MSHHQIEGVSQGHQEAFRVSHASTAYRCRYPHCSKASAGFGSESARSQHETCHFRHLYCNHEGCSYSRIGFDKDSSLVSHEQRHHAAKASLTIPPRIRGDGNFPSVASWQRLQIRFRDHSNLCTSNPLAGSSELKMRRLTIPQRAALASV